MQITQVNSPCTLLLHVGHAVNLFFDNVLHFIADLAMKWQFSSKLNKEKFFCLCLTPSTFFGYRNYYFTLFFLTLNFVISSVTQAKFLCFRTHILEQKLSYA